MVKRPLTRKELESRLRRAQILLDAYADQLDEVGKILVRGRIITRRAITKHGIRFALALKLEPRKTRSRKKGS